MWQTNFTELKTSGGGTWQISPVSDYVTKLSIACPVTATARWQDAVCALEDARAAVAILLGHSLLEDCTDQITGELTPVIVVTDNGPCYKAAAFEQLHRLPPRAHARPHTQEEPAHQRGRQCFNRVLKYEDLYRELPADGLDLTLRAAAHRDLYNQVRPHEHLVWARALEAFLTDPITSTPTRQNDLLVGRLLAAGLKVMAIHPNQVAAARDRFRAAAGKDDRFDAFVLCELARTDSHRFNAMAPSSDETDALRILVRTREDLVEIRVHLANQLRAQLDACWPGARRIFADVDSAIGLAFLARYPCAADTRGLGPKRLEGFLHRHGYAGRRTPEQLPQSAPVAVLGDLQSDAHRAAVLGLVTALTPIEQQIRQLTSQIRGALHEHPDEPIFTSFFKDPKSVLCAAGLLAEIGDNRARYPSRVRRRRRPSTRLQRIRQTPPCDVPLGLRQTPAQPLRRPRRKHPPLAPLGHRHLYPRHRPRLRTRHTRARPRLDPRPVALLARQPALRRRPPPQPHQTSRQLELTQDVS